MSVEGFNHEGVSLFSKSIYTGSAGNVVTAMLPAGIDQVVGKLRYHLDVGHSLVENDAIDGFHVLFYEVHEWLEALCGIPRLVQWDDNTHVFFLGFS